MRMYRDKQEQSGVSLCVCGHVGTEMILQLQSFNMAWIFLTLLIV